jgi:hypothetical protein
MMTSSDPRGPRPGEAPGGASNPTGSANSAKVRRRSGRLADGSSRPLLLLGVALAALAALSVVLVMVLSALHVPLLGVLGARTPTAPPTATPVEKALFQDALTDPKTRNWPSDGQCQPQADGYHIASNTICLGKYAMPSDANIRVDVRQISGLTDASYGITFRRASAGSFYSFEIDSAGKWYCFKAVDGQLRPVVGGSNAAIHKGLNATNSLLVRLSGSHFTFYVNGQLMGSAEDTAPAYASGQVGLDGNEHIEVIYTNFSVTKTVG